MFISMSQKKAHFAQGDRLNLPLMNAGKPSQSTAYLCSCTFSHFGDSCSLTCIQSGHFEDHKVIFFASYQCFCDDLYQQHQSGLAAGETDDILPDSEDPPRLVQSVRQFTDTCINFLDSVQRLYTP